MKWLAAGVAVAGMALAVAVLGFARESKLDPAAEAERVPAVAPSLSTEPAARLPLRSTPQAPRPQPARECRQDDDEESDRSGEDESDVRTTGAGCGAEDESERAGDEADENERAGDEADENEGRGDQASDNERGDNKDDQAGDSDGSGD